MPRPYVTWSIAHLEELFQSQGSNPEVLGRLVEELALRKTDRARRLLAKVGERIAWSASYGGGLAESEELYDYDVTCDRCGRPTLRKRDRSGVFYACSGYPECQFIKRVGEAEDGQEPLPIENLPQSRGGILHGEHEEEDRPSTDAIPEYSEGDQMPLWSDFAAEEAEQPPDDRSRPKVLSRIRDVDTPGLPASWNPPLKGDTQLSVAADSDLPLLYAAALSALIDEIKRTGAGQKRYELEKGIRAQGNIGGVIYEFVFVDAADLFEDAKVEVEVPGRRVPASIISISDGRIRLSTNTDLGAILHRAVLLVDATALLEALTEKVEQVGKGEVTLNRAIADAVVGRVNHPADPAPIRQAVSKTDPSPNAAQVAAVRKALTSSITYIWGPPGTGKTCVLAEVVRSAFDEGKRVLICSNTNRAVDQVLLRICESLTQEHPAMTEGRIVRLGQVTHDKLEPFEQFVTVDGIVERLSVHLKERQHALQDEVARIDARSAIARSTLTRFAELDAARKVVDLQQEATNQFAKAGRELKANQESLDSRLAYLEEELRKRREAFFTLFKRSEESILGEIADVESQQVSLASKIENVKAQYSSTKEKFESAGLARDQIAAKLSGLDRNAAEQQVAHGEAERAPLIAELREISVELEHMRSDVIRNARILGATCTKTYLSVKDLRQIDMVIIDEASMVLLPMIWFAAGLARERVVVCGDFRQLPPIVQTDQQAVFDVLGLDVFESAGLAGHAPDDPRMVNLMVQYRMHPDICRLISEPMYRSALRTSPDRTVPEESAALPPPYDGTLTVVDTSDLWPFESVNAFRSRFNLMHALLVRNLVWHFRQRGYVQEGGDLAVCTPYTAQAKLIRKLLDKDDPTGNVQVGVVHSLQGDERKTIVLELPEGHGGGWKIGRFLQGVIETDTGSRLMNVAVSRAQNHFIVLANLTHLDRYLPSHALLRNILCKMQQNGRVVCGSDLLALRPIESDLEGLTKEIPLDFEAEKLVLFNASTFDAALESDIKRAKESVVILSGFVTPGRVGELGDLLRLKVSQGVKVRCVTRPPHLNGSMDPALGREALNSLEAIGCTVDCRAKIHEKVVLIDKKIVWHGSLNALSHTHRTDEIMTRLVNQGFAETLSAQMSKRRTSNEKAARGFADAENPRCGRCGHRTYYDEGKYGPFFKCEESACGWSENLTKEHRAGGGNSDLPSDGPSCPICNSMTRLRNGPYGPFYRCIKAPACSGKCQPPGKSRPGRRNRTIRGK